MSDIFNLQSREGKSFHIPREWLKMSGFLTRQVDQFNEQFKDMPIRMNLSRLQLDAFDSETIELVVRYMEFKSRNDGQKGMPDFKIESRAQLMKLMMAADFLEL